MSESDIYIVNMKIQDEPSIVDDPWKNRDNSMDPSRLNTHLPVRFLDAPGFQHHDFTQTI